MTRARRGSRGFGPQQVGFVFFNAYLVDARLGAPETSERFHFTRVSFHAHHLYDNLQLRSPLMLHAAEAAKVLANLLEARALAVVFVRLFRGAVEAERNVL